MKPTLFANGLIINEGFRFIGSVVIDGLMFSRVDYGRIDLREVDREVYDVVDCEGKMVIPGVIDEHVHFRDPGMTEKGDLATESRAAIAGGVTSFFDMPNTRPATVSTEAVEAKMRRASEVSLANYGFFIGATADNIDALATADYSSIAGVKLFLGSSTGGMLLTEQEYLEKLFSTVPALIAVHAEDEAILRANRDAVVARYGENLTMDFHPVIRNHRACFEASKRVVDLARRHNHRLHLLHVSTADELSLLHPGTPEGKLVTAETCPQYLAFSDEQYAMLGTRIKCNPAIKRPADRDALRDAVNTGLIDTIATDHAPHLPEEKSGTALTAASGMPLIQFSLTLMLQMAEEGFFTVPLLVEKMAHNPAIIYGIERRGFIRPGYYADLTLVNNDCEPYTITDQWVLSRCGWTPLDGLTVSNKVDMTWVNGRLAYRFGVGFSDVRGLPLSFGHKNQ